MRLINCKTFEFEEVYQPGKLQYAILSHRWGEGEVSYQDMIEKQQDLVDRKGYQKIKSFCSKTLEQHMTYAWIDTCCIDQKSSAELSEAINSMYRWYCHSTICYVYLHDIAIDRTWRQLGSKQDHNAWVERLRGCSWFYRGWTLQELIGPTIVYFFDQDWNLMGSKSELAQLLSAITHIPSHVLLGETDIHSLTIAERMAWAAERECSRDEDVAYSLLGIFDVNMPLLYGEGTKAFQRLQEEIIRHTNDHTIFLWQFHEDSKSSMLASSPGAFNRNWKFMKYEPRSSYAITNNGLAIQLRIYPWFPDIYLAFLDCAVDMDNDCGLCSVGLWLKRDRQLNVFHRITLDRQHLYVVKKWPPDNSTSTYNKDLKIDIRPDLLTNMKVWSKVYGFRMRDLYLNGQHGSTTSEMLHRATVQRSYKHVVDEAANVTALKPGMAGNVVHISFDSASSPMIEALELGFDFNFQPACVIWTRQRDIVTSSTLDRPKRGFIIDKASTKPVGKTTFFDESGWFSEYDSKEDSLLPLERSIRIKPPSHLPTSSRHCRSYYTVFKLEESNEQLWRVIVRFDEETPEVGKDRIWDFGIGFHRMST